MAYSHLEHELSRNPERVIAQTQYGRITGGRAVNGAAVFLEIPYALPPRRFHDPEALPPQYQYEDKEYVKEKHYAFQPNNDGQVAHIPFVEKVGLGKPSETPLFVNIICPPSTSFDHSGADTYPVKIFIHGGGLQWGSPHNLNSVAQYVSAARSEVWVNVGYRLSVFGFLACDEPRLDGNYGFKDQWTALLWIKDNIAAFGGSPDDMQIVGLSAGAHSVHQILHHVSRLPPGEKSPFTSAMLQSNAILANPKTPAELRPQYHALCRALGLDPHGEDTLAILRDPSKTPPSRIIELVETDALGIAHGTFRGCTDGTWLSSSPDPMSWQRTGRLAAALTEKGVRSIVLGDLSEEWYILSLTNATQGREDVVPNLNRYYPAGVVAKLVDAHGGLPEDASLEQAQRLFGEVLCDGQVYLPVRILARDLHRAGFPVLRYHIKWTPEQSRPRGYVSHASDRPLWMYYTPALSPTEQDVARRWLDAVYAEVQEMENAGRPSKDIDCVLTLKENTSIGWTKDDRWDSVMDIAKIVCPQDE